MKALISNATPQRIITGTPQNPLDVIIQNISANTVYVSFDIIEAVTNNGLKIISGASYTNDCLMKPLYVLADVDASEIRYEIQPSVRGNVDARIK